MISLGRYAELKLFVGAYVLYNAGRWVAAGDLGVDLIAERGDYRCAVQAKRQSQPVARRAVSDAVAGMAHYDCNAAMVVTNNYFTEGAVELARSTGCELIDRGALAEWVFAYGHRPRYPGRGARSEPCEGNPGARASQANRHRKEGRHRGGDGAIRRVRFLEPMTAAMLACHRRIPPYGLNGGEAGAVGRNWVERTDGTREEFGGTHEIAMRAGDVFVIETPGGGGYGGQST